MQPYPPVMSTLTRSISKLLLRGPRSRGFLGLVPICRDVCCLKWHGDARASIGSAIGGSFGDRPECHGDLGRSATQHFNPSAQRHGRCHGGRTSGGDGRKTALGGRQSSGASRNLAEPCADKRTADNYDSLGTHDGNGSTTGRACPSCDGSVCNAAGCNRRNDRNRPRPKPAR